jgi:hypothetical protein
MSITTTTLYGIGNSQYRTEAQGGVYENWSYTSRLNWNTALTAHTPTGEAILAPTVGVSIPHTLFMGNSSGYWVHTLYLNGHRVGTFTFVDQDFAISIPHDRAESVALPFAPTPAVAGVAGDDPCVPSPAGAAVLLCAAVLTRFRQRKA